jgi:hypothetical protein
MFRFFCVTLIALLVCSSTHAAAGGFAWIEGETPTSVIPNDFTPRITGGSSAIISSGKWLNISIDAAKTDAAVPDTGVEFHYAFQSPDAGDYNLWVHIGYEAARSPCDWQIDHGSWQEITRDAPTVDVRELGVWAPVAWMNLGKQKLTAGPHEIAVRFRKVKNKDGKTDAILFGLDAFCITSVPFHPDGTIQPADSSWMTDADRSAARQIFNVPGTADATESKVSLRGQWQYAGNDETLVEDRLGPTTHLPDSESLHWHAMQVPGDRNSELPSEKYVHRFCLRTRVNIPAELTGHSFIVHIPDVNMIATLFVNGQQCGWTNAPDAPWDCDVTRAIRPGQTNEIEVAIKDAFYGIDSRDSQHLKYVPYDFWHFNLTNSLDMPVLGHYYAGIVRGEPSLIVAGRVYSSDVFAKPSVKNKSLALEITLHNSTDSPVEAVVGNTVEPLDGGRAEKTFAPVTVTIPAGQDLITTVNENWSDPKLWWPDDPQQYNVITWVSVAGKPIDQIKTKFGFREWSWDGPDFELNGIPFHAHADTFSNDIATMKKHHQTMVRVWNADENTDKYLDDCDARGMCVRRTSIFDGEGVGGLYGLNHPALWDHYRQQMIPWIKAQRNHPSIFIWSIENEITFINGGHYMEPPYNTLPESVYDKAGYAHRQVWPITQVKPILFGECAFLSGNTPAEMAVVGGEEAAIGTAEARPARGAILRMLSEGYRWDDINFQFWTRDETDFYNAWSPVAVLCRQWGWTVGSGQSVKRTLGIFNDTRWADPITFRWVLTINGKDVASYSSVHQVAPGGSEKFDVKLTIPAVANRQEGTWTLTLARNGKDVFSDVKEISILPPVAKIATDKRPQYGEIAVFDPIGRIRHFLDETGIPAIPLKNLSKIPDDTKVLIIGNDALDVQSSTSSQLAGWAVPGKVLIVLEQKYPLKFQGLPAEMGTGQNHGCLAFAEDLTDPVFDGLQPKDFLCWGSDNWTYRNAYVKPASGGKSLIQCDKKLQNTALVQMQSGKGILLLSQMLIGEKIADSAVAQRLLVNLVKFGVDYKLVSRDTAVFAGSNPQLIKALDTAGLQYDKPADVMGALTQPGSVAVIDANPANLATLVSHHSKVTSFTNGGGWIILNRLTPAGLADYNTLVGVDHLIRPFRAEKVTWPTQRNPLTAGLPAANVVFGTGKKIMSFAPPEYPDPNAYSYVVDLDDVAPFAASSYYGWSNAVNGFTQKDGAWQLIENLPARAAVMPITLPRAEKIQKIVWCSDNNYNGCKQIEVTINGKTYPFDTEPHGDEQTFGIPDEPTTSQLTIRITDWEHKANGGSGDQTTVGIDNVWIKVARPADFFDRVKPMLNIGAMVEYPQGKGGIILCNLNFRDSEENPENMGKKQMVIASILRNLHARFSSGEATLIPGNDVQYTPIDLSKSANQYRGEQGWFGDPKHTFEALPVGNQLMAGVMYDVYHFTTSIVPEAIMLKGNGTPGDLPGEVTGIPVNQKADALFFLQAAHLEARLSDNDRKKGKKYEIADYIIHYTSGSKETVPVYAGMNVDDYHQAVPTPIPGAQIAWQHSYGPSDGYAVAYSMQWNNPHPKLEIASIDLVYGPDHRGTPALLAITAASAK